MNIAILDDSKEDLKQIRSVISSYYKSQNTDADIHLYSSAESFFQKYSPGIYDLIIMDIMMPVMGGLEAAHVIRTMEREDSNKVPIVAISANAFDEDIHRSLASGMNAHLSKPVEIDKLRETLGRLLK